MPMRLISRLYGTLIKDYVKKERKKERKKIESQAIYNGCKFSVVVLRMLAIAL